ncbi:MAG: EF-hand domain-containing protein, partial [Pseudomonadota bacterium]
KPDDLLLVAPVPFAQLDKNGSGFLEGDETPPLIHAKGRASFTVNKNGERELQADQLIIDHSSLRQSFYKQADSNSDGRVSPQEFAQWAQPDREQANKKMNAGNAN